MNEHPQVLLLGASRQRQKLAMSVLAQVATVHFDVAALSTPPTSAAAVRVVLVDLAGPDPDAALRTLTDVHASAPDAQLVALAASKDPDLILRAMRAGACEFALLDDPEELPRIVSSLMEKGAEKAATGTVISVLGVKGGSGATTFATNLAGALCSHGKRVLLVDFDRHAGDVLVFLDVTTHYTLQDVARNLHRLDRDLLLSSLTRHGSGVYVLAQPDALEELEPVDADAVPSLLGLFARHFDYVVCDGLCGFTELSVAVLDASQRVELLFVQDVPSLKNAKHCLGACERLGYDDTKVRLLVNRYQKDVAIDLSAIADSLGREVYGTLSNDYRAASAAVNRGVLVNEASPRSKLTLDVATIAADIAGIAPKPRGGFLSALFGRASSAPSPTRTPKPQPYTDGVYDGSGRTPETT